MYTCLDIIKFYTSEHIKATNHQYISCEHLTSRQESLQSTPTALILLPMVTLSFSKVKFYKSKLHPPTLSTYHPCLNMNYQCLILRITISSHHSHTIIFHNLARITLILSLSISLWTLLLPKSVLFTWMAYSLQYLSQTLHIRNNLSPHLSSARWMLPPQQFPL